jgi:hypothetical protein
VGQVKCTRKNLSFTDVFQTSQIISVKNPMILLISVWIFFVQSQKYKDTHPLDFKAGYELFLEMVTGKLRSD